MLGLDKFYNTVPGRISKKIWCGQKFFIEFIHKPRSHGSCIRPVCLDRFGSRSAPAWLAPGQPVLEDVIADLMPDCRAPSVVVSDNVYGLQVGGEVGQYVVQHELLSLQSSKA